ncbi:MAG: alanine--tRNA ligase [bacterium]
MTTKEIRDRYLEFFEERGHKIIPSALIVPRDDPTTLFTSSGMQPLVPYLLGKPHPEGKRLVDSQKCLRTNDIEEVGDNRHSTFFEMLGNWSLGDYFKKEQLSWFFEFLTEELKLNPQKLFVTVFEGNEFVSKDNESIEIWKEIFKKVGIEAKEGERIFVYPAGKNWWSRSGEPENMPTGEPGGPDSEVFYDFGEELKLHEQSVYKNEKCHPNCDCGRFMEIGNNVFMQYQKQADGSLKEMAQKNVDFGGSLERMAAATINCPDIFKTDILWSMIQFLESMVGLNYDSSKNITKAMRIITDHIRAAVFLINEEVLPVNVGQGYILRRLLRRAIRYSRELKMEKGAFAKLIDIGISAYENTYPELAGRRKEIIAVVSGEEEKFTKTLDQGIKLFNKLADNGTISGIDAFHLYDTYGFPFELTIELAKERNVKVDKNGFDNAFKNHQELSRAGAEKKFGGVGKNATDKMANLHTATHLLHQALGQILGNHIQQMGSDITTERLRFDFSHPSKLTSEEISQVEGLVNGEIKKDQAVNKEETSYDEAIKNGALSFFKEKYPSRVTVYSIGTFSKEVCAGPHADHTGQLGKFKIDKEESSSAGVRRIKASLS